MNKQSNASPWSRLVRVPDRGYRVTTLINPKLSRLTDFGRRRSVPLTSGCRTPANAGKGELVAGH